MTRRPSTLARALFGASTAQIIAALWLHSVGVAVIAWFVLWAGAIAQDRANRR